ncbi:MAG TPA: TonB-dependent receptor, partial [Dongiaceae bacterium]|nr:TonB-dependent receptor [Dongiaceae bacterium]
ITLEPSNGGTTRQQGMDLSARAGIARWLAAFVHFTVNNSHYVNLITDSGDTLSGKPVYQVAKYTGEFGFDADWKGITGSLWAAYMGSWTPVDEPGTLTKPYTLLNLRALFPISGPWSGVVGVQNILDQKYVEVQAAGFLSPGKPRQVLFTIRHGF